MRERMVNHDLLLLFEGVAGSSKTFTDCCLTLMRAEKYPRSRHLWLRKTRKSMTDSVLKTFENDILPPGSPIISGPSRSHRDRYTLSNGSEIALGGMDRPDKFLSSEWDTITYFEAIEGTEDEAVSLLRCFRGGRMGYYQLTFETNPGPTGHFLNQWGTSGKCTRIATTHRDNPAYWDEKANDYTEAGRHYRDKVLAEMTGHRRLWYLEGKWANAEGLVYPGFSRETHVIQPFQIPDHWRRYRTIDFGYTNPFACLWVAEDEDGRMYVYRQIYHTRRLVEDHAKQIIELSTGERIDATVGDHDAEDRATLDRRGVYVHPAPKAVGAGIQSVTNRLRVQGDGRPRLMVFADSVVEVDAELRAKKHPIGLAEEFESYAWRKDRTGKASQEEPEKMYDHALDAIRMLVLYRDGAPTVWVADPDATPSLAPRVASRPSLVTLDDDVGWADLGI